MYRKIVLYITLLFNGSVSCLKQYPSKYISYRKIKDMYKDIYGNIYDTPNLEHIVPQSKLKKDPILKKDMHNILWYPRMLNIHRSNYKYTDDETIYEKSLILDEQGLIYDGQFYNSTINSIKTANMNIFCPRTSLRGEISRSCLYFAYTYEKYKDIILGEVINKDILLEWHETYPVTELEEIKNNKINKIQGNSNIFISEPEFIYNYLKQVLK